MLCSERNCRSKGPAKEGIHQLSDFFWQCQACYDLRKNTWQATHVMSDWPNKPTVDSLLEAVNYFAYLNRNRPYDSFDRIRVIPGSRGDVCHVARFETLSLDSFQQPWVKSYLYYICYNREFLPGYKAAHAFERPSKKYHSYDWQTVHSKIIAEAIQKKPKYDGVRIVIIMKSKKVFYVDPPMIRKWADEYECERYPPGEDQLECSIPISKLELEDPFVAVVTQQEVK